MKARLQVSCCVTLALLLFLSCTRPPFSLRGIHTEVSLVQHVDSEGSLTLSYESLSVFVQSEEDANLQMEVTSPDGLDTWLFTAIKKSVDKQQYYGKPALSLGERMPIPRGEWSLRILKDDGRTIAEHFIVEKGSEPQSLQHQLDAKKGLLVLDEKVNECALHFLDEKKTVLYSTVTTDHTIDLAKLYPKWDKVRFLTLSWYDEAAKMSQVVWYDL